MRPAFWAAIGLACAIGASWAQEGAPAAGEEAGEPFVASLPDTLAGAAGTWDLSRDGTNRRCVMILVDERVEAGRRLAYPAGCRRALPILNGIAGWLFADGVVRLVDRNVRPVLLFARRPDQRSLSARAEGSEDAYSLVPLQIQAMRPPEAAGAEPAAPFPSVPSPSDATPSVAAVGVAGPGNYVLDRYREPDVCRLALEVGAGGAPPVRVLDGCRDSGLTTFDPVAWRAAPGRLTLVARRGHTVSLVPAGGEAGAWRRDPETGTTFVLRKVGALNAGSTVDSPR